MSIKLLFVVYLRDDIMIDYLLSILMLKLTLKKRSGMLSVNSKKRCYFNFLIASFRLVFLNQQVI